MGEGQVAQGGGSEVVPALVGAGKLPTNDFFAHPPTAKRPHSLSLSLHTCSANYLLRNGNQKAVLCNGL